MESQESLTFYMETIEDSYPISSVVDFDSLNTSAFAFVRIFPFAEPQAVAAIAAHLFFRASKPSTWFTN